MKNQISKMGKKQDFIERASNFAIQVIRFTKTLPKERAYWVITDQLIRSSCSIGANMTEANSASSKKDYVNFYSHALKSANETKYWLDLLKKLTVDSMTIEKLYKEVEELSKILGASIVTMKKGLSKI